MVVISINELIGNKILEKISILKGVWIKPNHFLFVSGPFLKYGYWSEILIRTKVKAMFD